MVKTVEQNRPFATEFYVGRQLVKTNHALDLNEATKKALGYLQIEYYGAGDRAANTVQIVDTETGLVQVEMKRSVTGTIRTSYQHDPKKAERRLAIHYWK